MQPLRKLSRRLRGPVLNSLLGVGATIWTWLFQEDRHSRALIKILADFSDRKTLLKKNMIHLFNEAGEDFNPTCGGD